MSRLSRKPSSTGIHHVMMRGINHQEIFHDEEDYFQFINTLAKMQVRYDDEGNPCGTNYSLYAYCLMSNHVHLLIREHEDYLGMAIKRISSSYVFYFNRKYSRDGHLFKERFRSEPVNDMAYFTVLLRYIHQNPVKAGLTSDVNAYVYSSWGEYTGQVDPAFCVCNTTSILHRMPFHELEAFIQEPLPDDVACLDNELEKPKLRLSDDQVWQHIAELASVNTAAGFQQIEKNQQREILSELKRRGASVRQLERLTGISRGVIQST